MRKNKLFTAVLTATTLTLSINASACAPYYPLDELDASGISQDGLNHFKQVLKDSGLFEKDNRFAIKVGAHAGDFVATIFVLDYTGKELARYFTADDEFENDVLSAVYDGLYGWEYQFDHYFSYNLELSGNKIYGTRSLPDGWQDQTSSVKKQLIEAGYPDLYFIYQNKKFHYGEFKISGDLAEDLMDVAFGNGSIGIYEFDDSYGTLYTERVD